MLLRRKNKTKRKHKCWIRGIFLRRREHGQLYTLFQELKYTTCLFFCKMALSTYFESDWTLHNTCFKANDCVADRTQIILDTRFHQQLSCRKCRNGRESRTRFICRRSLQTLGTDVSMCLQRGTDLPVIVSQTDRRPLPCR